MVSSCEILVTELNCAAPPLMAPPEIFVGAGQVYVVFAGTIKLPPFAGVILKVALLQIVCVCVVMEGFGLTVTVNKKVDPTQFPVAPDFGVMV